VSHNRFIQHLLAAVLTILSTACEGDAQAGSKAAASPSARRFWLPTGEVDNTSAPTVEIDARGGVHSVYPAYAGGRAYYSYCPNDCADPEKMKVVRFNTEESIHNGYRRSGGRATGCPATSCPTSSSTRRRSGCRPGRRSRSHRPCRLR
jgi:hypothetical protein